MKQEAKTRVHDRVISYTYGSLTLIIIGMFLIALNSYSPLLTLYSLELAFNLRWHLLYAYIAGIALVIVGATFHTRLTGLSVSPLQKPYLIVGETLLTISVFGQIVHLLMPSLMFEYPYSLHSLAAVLLRRVDLQWLTPTMWIIGSAGWLILLIGRIALSKSTKRFSLLKWSEWALALGAVIFLTSLFLYISERLLVIEATLSLYEPSFVYTFYFAYVHPLGILSLTFGWAAKTPTHLSKHPILLPALYAALIIAITALLLILI